MKKLKKTLKELLFLFIDLQPVAIDEIKRAQKVIRGLHLILQLNLRKLKFDADLSVTFASLYKAIPAEIWRNWVIRRLCYNFSVLHSCSSKTTQIYLDLLNYIKNLMPISKSPEDCPLHKAVVEHKLFRIRQICIGEEVSSFFVHIDQPDCAGNSALMLAVKLKLYDEVQVLVDHGADAKFRLTPASPSPLEQAIAMDDKVMLKKLVSGYHREINNNWNEHVADFAQTLSNIPDFSMTMSWECVSSFIPFLKKFTPSDEYHIYKKGNNLKIDLSLIGWEQFKPKRGKMSLVFNGDLLSINLIDHNKKTSRELFTELSNEQVEKHTEVIVIKELIKDKKYSGDIKFSNCVISPKKNWRGTEETSFIEGYFSKHFEVRCNLALSLKKRQVAFDKELQNVRTFEDYLNYCARDTHSPLILSSRVDKRTQKKIKASVWGSQNFPLKLSDLMPLLDLLATVSEKAKKFQDFLYSTDLLQQIGFPIKAKIPLMLTVTALIVFKNLKIGNIDNKEFDIELYSNRKQKYVLEEEIRVTLEDFEENDDESDKENFSDTVIGPKLRLSPAPQMKDDEAETTFINDYVNIGVDLKEKLKIVELHNQIVEKVQEFIEMDPIFTNDVDVLIL